MATSKHITTSHRRISTRGAHTHKATSTRITTSHRRMSTRGAHRLRSQRPNQYTITTFTPVRRDRTNLPPPAPSKMPRRKRRRVPLLPMVRGTAYLRPKGQRYCPAMHRRIRHLNNDLTSSRKPWWRNHPHADGTSPTYYSNVSCNPE